ncbi:MAG: choice-of-anchor D domain-containing protein [Bacteroidota bacterium]
MTDTTVIIQNRGAQPLLISNITSTTTRFNVLRWSQLIDPLSNGSVTIRFSPTVPESVQGFVVINSNSRTSPDTIVIRGESIAAAVLSLPTNTIYFGGVVTGGVLIRSISIANVGNIPMTIDSVRWVWNRPEFSLISVGNVIAPQESGTATFSFTGPPGGPAGIGDRVRLYSNSLTSPDSIWLYGEYVSRPNILFSHQSMDFDSTEIGTSKDMTLSVTNLMGYTIGTQGSVPQQSCFLTTASNARVYLSPQATMYDTIRFAPTSAGSFSDTVIYSFYMLGIVVRTDTLVLRGQGFAPINTLIPQTYTLFQNYPNPFNSTTRIEFQIPRQAHVELKVFDLLGRVVATLVNEEMAPGAYRKTFDGSALASGVYFYRLWAGDFVLCKKLVLLR